MDNFPRLFHSWYPYMAMFKREDGSVELSPPCVADWHFTLTPVSQQAWEVCGVNMDVRSYGETHWELYERDAHGHWVVKDSRTTFEG